MNYDFLFENKGSKKTKLSDLNFQFSQKEEDGLIEGFSMDLAIPIIEKELETNLDTLKEEILEISKDDGLTCKICNKTFKLKHHLRRHQVIHENIKEFECKICHKKFNQESNLATHVKNVHQKVKDFECDICHKKFNQKGNLSKHKLIHDENQQFQCEICEKKFSQKTLLDSHMNVHEGKTPFQCKFCLKSFSRPSTLFNHQKIHQKMNNTL